MNRSNSHRLSFNPRGEQGFTLVEVLVAISILVIVLTSVYGVFTSVSRARDRLDVDSAEYHRARVIFDRIGRELRGAYFQPSNRDLIFSGGTTDDGLFEMELTTSAVSPLIQTGSGIARVRYLLVEDRENPDSGLVLMRSEHAVHEPVSDDEPAGMMRLAPGVDGMSLRFLSDGRWQSRWDGLTAGMPELVELSLQLRSANQDPVRFVSAFDIPKVEPR